MPTTPLARTTGAARARGGGRAFTLLELAVVIAVMSVLFVMLTSWILDLSRTASSGNDAAGPARDAAHVEALLAADLAAARTCDPSGLGAPLKDLRADAVQLHVGHAAGDGGSTVDLAMWRLSGTALQRALIPGDGTCSFDVEAARWTTVATGVSAGDAPAVFTGVGNRFDPDGEPYYGSCDGLLAERCLDRALGVSLSFVGAGGPPTAVERDFDLPAGGSGL